MTAILSWGLNGMKLLHKRKVSIDTFLASGIFEIFSDGFRAEDRVEVYLECRRLERDAIVEGVCPVDRRIGDAIFHWNVGKNPLFGIIQRTNQLVPGQIDIVRGRIAGP